MQILTRNKKNSMPITAKIYKQTLDNCAKDMHQDFDKMKLEKNPNMKEIHKTEIIPSLLAGWKVRRKCWKDGFFLERTQSIDTLMQYYQYDDWEAEPPKPVMVILYSEQFLEDAISLIRKDTKRFIRRHCVYDVWTTIGWHNNELWHLDIENKLDPSHQVVFRGDSSFKVNNWNVCVLE